MELREPLPYQVDAIEYCLNTQHPALLMEMRLGKTLVAIRSLRARLSNRSIILVVAPLTVLSAWERELNFEGEIFHKAFGMSSPRKMEVFRAVRGHKIPARIWALTNYETLRSCMEIATWDWDAVILDESTKIKTPGAQISQVCAAGFRKVTHRYILTGLIAPENPLEMFSQFKFLSGWFMGCGNIYQFRSKFFKQSTDPWNPGWLPKPRSLEYIHEAMHSTAFVLRRKDVNVGSKKQYETRSIKLTAAQLSEYDKVEKHFEVENMELTTSYILVLETWLGRMAGGWYPNDIECGLEGEQFHDTKANEIVDLLTGELAGEQAVVWFRFNKELDDVAARLRSKGVHVGTIQGSVSILKRGEEVNRFRAGSTRIICCQIACGKFGLDFSTAGVAIYYSNAYSCEARAQSEDRIIHPTDKAPKLIIDMVTRGTIDEKVVEMLQDKKRNSQYFMSNLKKYIDTLKDKVRS